MLISVHTDGVVTELEVDVEERVRTLLDGGAAPGAGVYLEERDESLDATLTFREAGVVESSTLHVGGAVRVTVRYGGASKERTYSPGAHVRRVLEWAVGEHGFDLPSEQRAKHALGLCGTTAELDPRSRVGGLATEGALCLDLSPKVRYQG